jgi:hypothetical protein
MPQFLNDVVLDSLVEYAPLDLAGKLKVADFAFPSGEKYIGQSAIQWLLSIGSVLRVGAAFHERRAAIPPVTSHPKGAAVPAKP